MTGRESEELVLLKQRVTEMIRRYRLVKEELTRALEETQRLDYELKAREAKYADLVRENERLKLSGAILGDGDSSPEAKKRINGLVREIDNCIALLNNI
jgi:hypothetical protein